MGHVTVADLLPAEELIGVFDLYARYTEALDGDAPGELADCFTPDATWESDIMGVRRGATAIGGLVAEMARLGDRRPFHLTTGVRVLDADLGAGRATSRARWLAAYPRGRAVSFGTYRDEIGRSSPGAWRFRSRVLLRVSDPETFRNAVGREHGGTRDGIE